jgi:hypothetical protein
MKATILPLLLFAALTEVSAQTSPPITSLPAEAGFPTTSGTNFGFRFRVAQGPAEPALGNNLLRAVRQLNGTLVDASGVTVTNEAAPGPNPGGVYLAEVTSFEVEGSGVDVTDADGNALASFTSTLFPGVPGSGGHTSNFALEAIAFFDLPAGATTFGVSVAADRTDVNNDDAYIVYAGGDVRSAFATAVGSYARNSRPFSGNQRNENQWTVSVPVAGLYPFRLVYWQTGLGANLQWYTVNTNTGDRILINDSSNPSSLRVFADSTAAGANPPSVAEVSPSPGSEGVSPSEPISALLLDGSTTLSTAGVRVFLNGSRVTPQSLVRTSNGVRFSYDPNAARTDRNNLVRLEFTDSAGVARTNSWSFGINAAGAASTLVTGQWDFDQGNLSATVGTALAYLDGTGGLTATGTQFGTCSSLSVPLIGTNDARIMRVPGDVNRSIGYVMAHGIAPNGGGTRVNQFTIIYDVLVATSGPGAASLLQVSSTNNAAGDDGDLFWQGNNFGQGGNGYNGRGTFTAGEWHRVIAAYDMAATPPVVTKYVDGIKQDDWTANQSLDNPRRALLPTAVLFGDGDADERREMWVNSIQIRSGKLTDAECALLGGPDGNPVPQALPVSNVTGQWDFEFADLGATVGTPLSYLDGATGLTQQGTQFGLCSELFVPLIGTNDARVMRVPGDVDRNIGYVMAHRILPNGGGTRVNQFTIIYDILVATSGPGAASLLQVSSTNNAAGDDGDLFWQGSNFGQGGNGYNGRGTFTAGEWHRVVAAYDMAATPPVVTKYVDGIKQDDWTANQSLDNPRRALLPTAVLFGDGDADERREMWVSSIQIRSGKLSDVECYLLGGPKAGGIPLSIPTSTVSGQWDFEFGDLGASIGSPLVSLDALTTQGTQFGTCSTLGVPLIGTNDARVMLIPGDLDRRIGYLMQHRISPNGGGTRVNQYTITFDILVAAAGPGAASLLQVSSTNNAAGDDGDLFWQGNNFGQGGNGYNGLGTFTAGEWHRVTAAYDMAATPPVVTKFVDGLKQDDWTANQSLDNPRRALLPLAVLFGDGDADERREMLVKSIQIRAGKLADSQMVALGSPDGAPLPVLLPEAAVVARPVLSIQRGATAGSVVISWTGSGFTLESRGALTGSGWTAVPGASGNSVTLQATETAAYFRVRQ